MKRHVKERQARNRELGALDAANRCWQCKRAFTDTGMIVESFTEPGRFCSHGCLGDYTDAAQTRPAKVGRR